MRLIAVLSSLLVLVCCGSEADVNDGPASASPIAIPFEAGAPTTITWPSATRLVVGYVRRPHDPAAPTELARLRPNGEGFRGIPLPQDQACSRTQYVNPIALGEGRLGVVKVCNLDGEQASIPTSYSLMQVAMAGGELAPLVTTEPLGYLSSFVPPSFTANPQATAAIVSAGNLLCGSIALVDRDGVRYFPVTVGEGGQTWRLDEWFTSEERLCTDQGRARGAAWSPDGLSVAFLGSPQSIGIAGQDRLDAAWNIYVMDTETWTPDEVLSDISYPSDPVWSPNGRWLAFSGAIRGRADGTWLFDVSREELVRISSAQLASPAWSPDGTRLAGLIAAPTNSGTEEVVSLDVSHLVT